MLREQRNGLISEYLQNDIEVYALACQKKLWATISCLDEIYLVFFFFILCVVAFG